MRILQRYLALEVHRATAVVLSALLALFTFFSLVDQLDQIGRNGFQWIHLLILECLAIPTRLYDLLPIGFMIGAILALATLAQRAEITIFRVSGISGLRLLIMLWASAVPLMIFAVAVGEYITPAAELKLNEQRLQLFGSQNQSKLLSSGYWFRETLDQEQGSRVINIKALGVGGSGKKLTLYEFNNKHQMQRLITAEQASFQSDGVWKLKHTTVTQIKQISPSQISSPMILLQSINPQNTNRAPIAFSDSNTPRPPAREAIASVRSEEQLDLATTLTPALLLSPALTPERMSSLNLLDYIHYLHKNQQNTERYELALWRKFVYPLTMLVMITIATPIGFMRTRSGSIGAKVFIGILLGVGFYMLSQLALSIGLISHWPATLTALAPLGICLTLALTFLYWTERR